MLFRFDRTNLDGFAAGSSKSLNDGVRDILDARRRLGSVVCFAV